MNGQDDVAATPQASGIGSGQPVPHEVWAAGFQAIRDEPRGACENARVWRVVYAVLSAAGFAPGRPAVPKHEEPCGFRDAPAPLAEGKERSDHE